jgi:hypothetical protein
LPKNSRTRQNQIWFVIGFAFFAGIVYFYSLCPDVYLIDSGELATVSYTLGVAHPTGYPLYTLISYFFAHLPGEPIKNLNMLSALFSIGAALILFITALRITKNGFTALLVAALFAFSPTIWRTSITNEVYPLTGLMGTLVLYLLYRCDNDRIYYMIMYLLGIAFTNHIIVFSLGIPVILYCIFGYKPGLKKVLLGAVFFGLGLTLYYYIIARTVGGARIAWGNAYNLQRLFWHVTGKQYQVWMFSLSPGEISSNLINGLKILSRDFLFLLAIPAIMGFIVLYQKERKKFWLFLAVFALNLLYTINYSIPDIEPYYIPGLLVLIITSAYGLQLLKRYLKPVITVLIAVAIPAINYGSCTLRSNTFGVDFGRAHVEGLPNSSLLIATYWDVYSPLLYLREVKGLRKDLVIIDKALLRRTWYIGYLESEYPEFYGRCRASINAYLQELYKFEYDRPYVPQVIQSRFIGMLESLVDAKNGDGVFLSTPWVDHDLNAVRPHWLRIPFGLSYKLTQDSAVIHYDFSKFTLKQPPVINDSRLENNINIVRNMLGANIRYLMSTGQAKAAERVRELLDSY